MIRQKKIGFDEYLRGELTLTLAFVMFAALLLSLVIVPLSRAQQARQRTFNSAEEASQALQRIGKNELAATDACRQLADAEREYYEKPYNGQPHYTERFVSDKGKHNGLYWSDAKDEFDSKVDPRIAAAGQQDAKSAADDSGPMPFNGYYFRSLTGQGNNVPGGVKNYIVDGKMTGGFAFVAYPAHYRSSGVMTFIVNGSGVVFEKDLGPDTGDIATAMTEYNPDSTWHRVD